MAWDLNSGLHSQVIAGVTWQSSILIKYFWLVKK